jgi:hypothetical protein
MKVHMERMGHPPLFVALFVFGFMSPFAHAQQVTATGVRIDIDNQNIVGAAFDDEAGTFFVQQRVYSIVDNTYRSHRRVTSWSVNKRTKIAERDFDLDPPPNQLNHLPPCGNIAVAEKTNHILVCRLDGLDVLDATSLRTIGKLALPSTTQSNAPHRLLGPQSTGQDQKTYELALDEARNRVLLLSSRSGSQYPLSYSGSLWLTSYSLLDGMEQQDVQLGSLGLVDHAELGFDPELGKVAVSMTYRGHNPWTSDIYLCNDDNLTGCAQAAEVDPVSQMSFFGNKLLFVVDRYDRKEDCVMGLDLNTHAVTRDYCAPATGVRFALGVVNSKYIVGFTGTRRSAGFLSEGYVNVQNSFSLWEAVNPRVRDTAKYLLNTGVLQRSMRVVVSTTEPLFLAYSEPEQYHQVELNLYSVSADK